jgi:uncharacterized membrane protein
MNTFILGMFIGGAVIAIIASLVFIFNTLKTVLGILQLLANKVTKIEKVSEHTMMAAENFVDALQQSAEQMNLRPPPTFRKGADEFQDLRETFEEGIRNLEEDDDSDSDEEEENWKKGT